MFQLLFRIMQSRREAARAREGQATQGNTSSRRASQGATGQKNSNSGQSKRLLYIVTSYFVGFVDMWTKRISTNCLQPFLSLPEVCGHKCPPLPINSNWDSSYHQLCMQWMEYVLCIFAATEVEDDTPVTLGFGIPAPPPSYKAAVSKKTAATYPVSKITCAVIPLTY